MVKRGIRCEEGFSLVEILVAMLLLTIVLSGSMALQLTLLQASNDSRATTGGMTLAQSQVERFRSALGAISIKAPANWIETGAVFKYDLAPCGVPCTTGGFFTRTTTHSILPSGAVRLGVTVTWPTNTTGISVVAERVP